MRNVFAAIILAGVVAAAPTQAGVYTDDLTKCLVASASPDDQLVLIKWVFGVISAAPQIKTYSTVTDAQRDALSKQTGQLMQRLLTKDCRTQAVAAIKYEGSSTFESSFEVLGQVAMRGLTSSPEVSKGFGALSNGVDQQSIVDLFKDAGVPQEAPAAK